MKCTQQRTHNSDLKRHAIQLHSKGRHQPKRSGRAQWRRAKEKERKKERKRRAGEKKEGGKESMPTRQPISCRRCHCQNLNTQRQSRKLCAWCPCWGSPQGSPPVEARTAKKKPPRSAREGKTQLKQTNKQTRRGGERETVFMHR